MKTQDIPHYEETGDYGLNEDFLKRLGWDDDDRQLLVDLAGTIYWPAVEKYYRLIDYVVTLNLRSTDPFKNPTIMAQNQGISWAINILGRYIESMKDKSQEATKTENTDKGQK